MVILILNIRNVINKIKMIKPCFFYAFWTWENLMLALFIVKSKVGSYQCVGSSMETAYKYSLVSLILVWTLSGSLFSFGEKLFLYYHLTISLEKEFKAENVFSKQTPGDGFDETVILFKSNDSLSDSPFFLFFKNFFVFWF